MRNVASQTKVTMSAVRNFAWPSQFHKRTALQWSFVLAGTLCCGGAMAFSLAGIVEQSVLGEPLRIVISVEAQPGEDLAGGCFRIVSSHTPKRDGIPDLVTARFALERTQNLDRLVVTTPRAINDLAIRLNFQAGCEQTIEREYVVLFDPPLDIADKLDPDRIVVPIGGAVDAQVPEVSTANSTPNLTPDAVTANVGGALPRAIAKMRDVRDPGKRRNASVARVRPAPRRAPRLEISHTAQASPPGTKAASENLGDLPKDAQVAAIEEQEVVLRQRVAQLSEQVERMQQDRIAVLTAQVERLRQDLGAMESAQLAADTARRSEPSAVILRWFEDYWSALLAVLAVATMATGYWVWRRRQGARYRLSGHRMPHASDDAGILREVANGEDSLFAHPLPFARRVPLRQATTAKPDGDPLATKLNEPEQAFELDLAREADCVKEPARVP
jgi:hypothetical protein